MAITTIGTPTWWDWSSVSFLVPSIISHHILVIKNHPVAKKCSSTWSISPIFFGGENSNTYLTPPPVLKSNLTWQLLQIQPLKIISPFIFPPGVRGHWVPLASRQFLLHKDARPTRSPEWSGQVTCGSSDGMLTVRVVLVLYYHIIIYYTMKFPKSQAAYLTNLSINSQISIFSAQHSNARIHLLRECVSN